MVGEKKRREKKNKKQGIVYVGGGEEKGNGNRGREWKKKWRKVGILGVLKKINILKNKIVKLK